MPSFQGKYSWLDRRRRDAARGKHLGGSKVSKINIGSGTVKLINELFRSLTLIPPSIHPSHQSIYLFLTQSHISCLPQTYHLSHSSLLPVPLKPHDIPLLFFPSLPCSATPHPSHAQMRRTSSLGWRQGMGVKFTSLHFHDGLFQKLSGLQIRPT